jgi:hypothetical protein
MKHFIVLGGEICLFFDPCIFIVASFGKILKSSKLSEVKWQIVIFILKKMKNSLHGKEAYFNLH